MISEPDVLIGIASEDLPVSCFGFSDGQATVLTTGGTSPYTYIWSNTSTTASVTNFSAGIQGVTITDANGCMTNASVTITEPPSFTAAVVSSTDASCTACIGTADLEITGGVGPFTYIWTNGNPNQDPNNLCSILNGVTVTDANGCIATAAVNIGNSTDFAIESVSVDTTVSCCYPNRWSGTLHLSLGSGYWKPNNFHCYWIVCRYIWSYCYRCEWMC